MASKLTCALLREQLAERGLPTSGLKAVLVARLEEYEAALDDKGADDDNHDDDKADNDNNDAAVAATAATSAPAAAATGLELLDPTLLFMGACLFSVVFVRGDPKTMSLVFTPAAELPKVAFNHVKDRAFLAGFIVAAAAAYLTRSAPRLGARAGWYLWNGVICHVMMDGMAGGHWGLDLMDQNYRILDKRFNWHLEQSSPGAPHPGDAANALLVTQVELWVHAPLCIAAYVAIKNGYATARAWELLALSFQLFGAIVFLGPELVRKLVMKYMRELHVCCSRYPREGPGRAMLMGFASFSLI